MHIIADVSAQVDVPMSHLSCQSTSLLSIMIKERPDAWNTR